MQVILLVVTSRVAGQGSSASPATVAIETSLLPGLEKRDGLQQNNVVEINERLSGKVFELDAQLQVLTHTYLTDCNIFNPG